MDVEKLAGIFLGRGVEILHPVAPFDLGPMHAYNELVLSSCTQQSVKVLPLLAIFLQISICLYL